MVIIISTCLGTRNCQKNPTTTLYIIRRWETDEVKHTKQDKYHKMTTITTANINTNVTALQHSRKDCRRSSIFMHNRWDSRRTLCTKCGTNVDLFTE